MKFTNLCVYKVNPQVIPEMGLLETALQNMVFAPCGATEPHRAGFVTALDDESTAYVHGSNDAWLVRLREQRRILPASVVREELERQVKEIQRREDRKVGKKETSRLKDEVILSMLPRAFTKTGDVLAIIAPKAGYIFVGASTLSKAETVLNAIRLVLGTFPVERPAFSAPAPSFFTAWLKGERELPEGFALADTVEIADEEATANCKGFDLTSEEIRKHLEAGREARKVSLVFEDSLRFTVLPDGRLKSLKLSERLIGDLDANYSGDKFQNLDAEFQMWALNVMKMVPKLFEGLGMTSK